MHTPSSLVKKLEPPLLELHFKMHLANIANINSCCHQIFIYCLQDMTKHGRRCSNLCSFPAVLSVSMRLRCTVDITRASRKANLREADILRVYCKILSEFKSLQAAAFNK